jgi:hypothetical protein
MGVGYYGWVFSCWGLVSGFWTWLFFFLMGWEMS